MSAHFARVRVTEISLDHGSRAQFARGDMLEAADLLADARPGAICWNATSAAWLGIEHDRALCRAITERTGVPASSCVLSLIELMRLNRVERYALVTPYLAAVQARILANLEREGLRCVYDRHLGERDNFAFAEVPGNTLQALVDESRSARPDAVLVLCTNLRAARLAAPFEDRTGILMLDSVAGALWGALRAAGEDPQRVRGWGRLFATPLTQP